MLQCSGRATAERIAAVLDLPTRLVGRRLAAMLASGQVQVVVTGGRPPLHGVMLLRIRVLRGKTSAVAAALAARDDIPMVDISIGGDQIIAVLHSTSTDGHQLVFRQLPETSAVTSVDAQTVLHVFGDRADWTLDRLTPGERAQLTSPRAPLAGAGRLTGLDGAIAAALARDGRRSASAIARVTGEPESTIRRRLATLLEDGRLVTQVIVDPHRLGLHVDVDLRMQIAPRHLDATGRALAAHPAVHGALAVTGPANLSVAAWLRDVDHLYAFITNDLADLGIAQVETLIIGETVKGAGPAGAGDLTRDEGKPLHRNVSGAATGKGP